MLYAAVILGLAGSLHCAGMCSPLMLAVTAHRPFIITKVVYNFGRVLTYGALGAMAATFGSWFALTRYQQVLSLSLGAVLVAIGFVGTAGISVPGITRLLARLTNWLRLQFGWALSKSSLGSRFLMGTLNGLLPCGLTYLALTSCFILPGAVDGFMFMLFFGLGTWPVMMGVSMLADKIGFRNWMLTGKAMRISLVFAGVLLIGRAWWVHDEHAHGTPSTEIRAEVLCL